jgi:uncharacterized protein (TIGR03086 family)
MPSSEVPLPTFIIIGAQKCGTRWLRVNLGKHPEVYTAPSETQFFHSPGRVETLGLDWYRGQFPGWAGESIVGEATPGYMMWRHHPRRVAERIKEIVPDVRLIAILRNPVDRAQSALIHHQQQREIPPDSSLLEVIEQRQPEYDPLGLVAGGWYATSLKRYRQLFGDQLLVLLHDDVTADPGRVYLRALVHIGADLDFAPSDLETVLFSNQRERGSGSSKASEGPRDLSEEERQRVFAYFRADVRALEPMIGRDLSSWDPGGSYSVELAIDPWKERPRRGAAGTPIDVVRCYEQTADWTELLVGNVATSQYALPTPCVDWNVRDLLNRIVWLPSMSAAVLRNQSHLPTIDDWAQVKDDLDDDAGAKYRAAAADLLSVLNEPGLLDRSIPSPIGEMPAKWWVELTFINQLTYGWDLATATDQGSTIPASLLEDADRLVRRVLMLMPRTPELFDEEVSVSETASPTQRFVAFLGRDPGFAPVDARSS